MTVTEIARILLAPGLSIENCDLRAKLAHAKEVMQTYTNRTFYYFQQIEDPSYVYIIGEWDSVDQHINHFIPGPENQAVLESLKDKVTVNWLLHIDAPHAELPLPKTGIEKARALNGELVWSIALYFVEEGEKDSFQQTFVANRDCLQEHVTEGTIGGAWRVDTNGAGEQYVLLSPWTSVKQHSEFAETEDFVKYDRISGYTTGAEINHVRLVDI